MKKILFILFFITSSSLLFAQLTLLIEGTVVNNTTTGTWSGVNISRSLPTNFTYRNNSITSVNSSGYMLQAGDEAPGSSNNNLDGEIITGNKFVWNGTDVASTITHALFAGYNINAVIKYNYLYRGPTAMVLKSNGMTYTSGGVSYNIINRTGCIGIAIKGINGVCVYNNTFYSDEVKWTSNSNPGTAFGIIDVFANNGLSPIVYSTGTKIKNNIFYTVHQIYNISIEEDGDLPGFESDYNIFYCEAGTPMFKYLGSAKTFAQWQALGYDIHSVVINPNFNNFTDFVPAVRLDYGTNLGSAWQTGLSTSAIWTVGSAPATINQNGQWQVGARIHSAQAIPVSGITVTGAGGSTTITADDGTLQLSAAILPSNATNKTLTWSILNGTGQGTISQTGLVTAVTNGTVTARAAATDGSGVYGIFGITISNQFVPVSGISVTGAGGATVITSDNGTLQLTATILPANATNKEVTWTLANGTGEALINSSGQVTAISDGSVTARATANDGSGIYGTLIITIASQMIPVTSISVTGAGGSSTISTEGGTLQLNAAVLPANATNKTVSWSVANGTGEASVNATGVLTAVANGTVTAIATANDGSGIFGTIVITISNQIVPVSGITVAGEGGISSISGSNRTLQLIASVQPSNATLKTITWSIINGTGDASIDAAGLVTAISDGTVTVKATANDGSAVYGTLIITITSELIPVTGISLTGEGGATTITDGNNPLQLSAEVLPSNASNKTVSWSVAGVTGAATINANGLVTALENGTVKAQATANDGSGIYGTQDLSINLNNQKPYSVIVTAEEIVIIFNEDFVSCFADLYNLQGNHIERKIIDTDTVRFSTSHITPGLYIIVLSRGELLAVEKVMVF